MLFRSRNFNRAIVQSLIISLLPLAGAFAGPVNLNSADATTLAKELDGIGPAKAQAIVESRQKTGPFRSPEDLLSVEGIGPKVLEQTHGNIRLETAAGGGAAGRGKAGRVVALMRYESTLNIIDVTWRQSISDMRPTGSCRSPNGK